MGRRQNITKPAERSARQRGVASSGAVLAGLTWGSRRLLQLTMNDLVTFITHGRGYTSPMNGKVREFLKGTLRRASSPHGKQLFVQDPVEILNQYVGSAPSDQNALDIFEGEWSSAFPEELQLRAGPATLFEDPRLEWLFSQLGGVSGMDVLELGPLEAGHTYMLEKAGAESILSIEANTRSYLKCLVVKEIFGLGKSRFLCGDFVEYLKRSNATFDLVVASGVLYHMRNPAEVISLLSEATDNLFVWTHYYDEVEIRRNSRTANKFPTVEMSEHKGFTHSLHKYEYQAALDWKGFCGGGAAHSNWMTRDDILRCLEEFGYSSVEIGFDVVDHPHGPSFALIAKKQH